VSRARLGIALRSVGYSTLEGLSRYKNWCEYRHGNRPSAAAAQRVLYAAPVARGRETDRVLPPGCRLCRPQPEWRQAGRPCRSTGHQGRVDLNVRTAKTLGLVFPRTCWSGQIASSNERPDTSRHPARAESTTRMCRRDKSRIRSYGTSGYARRTVSETLSTSITVPAWPLLGDGVRDRPRSGPAHARRRLRPSFRNLGDQR